MWKAIIAAIPLLGNLLSLIKDFHDPDRRSKLMDLARAKASDQALFKAEEMRNNVYEQEKNDRALAALRRTDRAYMRKVKTLSNKKWNLWKAYHKLDREYRKLLIKE